MKDDTRLVCETEIKLTCVQWMETDAFLNSVNILFVKLKKFEI
jgi:hypothetical protein